MRFLLGSREVAAHEDLDVYSEKSPLGSAIDGHSVGETVKYTAPNGNDFAGRDPRRPAVRRLAADRPLVLASGTAGRTRRGTAQPRSTCRAQGAAATTRRAQVSSAGCCRTATRTAWVTAETGFHSAKVCNGPGSVASGTNVLATKVSGKITTNAGVAVRPPARATNRPTQAITQENA